MCVCVLEGKIYNLHYDHYNNTVCVCAVCVVLQNVRQMEKSVLLTEGRLPAIRELIKRFSLGLTHGQNHLHKAHDMLQQTHNTHTHNLHHLQRREVRHTHMHTQTHTHKHTQPTYLCSLPPHLHKIAYVCVCLQGHKHHLMDNYNSVNQTVMSANDIIVKATVGVLDLDTMVTVKTFYVVYYLIFI